MLTTIQLPALDFRAAVSTVDVEERTAGLIFSTGADVRRTDPYGDLYIERLSLDPRHVRLSRLNAGAPLLNSHNAASLSDQIGVVVEGSATVDGAQGRATVRFSKRHDEIFQDVHDSIIRNVSVGYRVYKMEEVGKQGAAPVHLATDWEPFELSLVPMGADAGARVRGANPAIALHACELVIVGDRRIADADRLRRWRLARALGRLG